MANSNEPDHERQLAERAMGWGLVLYKSRLCSSSPMAYQLQTEPGMGLDAVKDFLDQLGRGAQ